MRAIIASTYSLAGLLSAALLCACGAGAGSSTPALSSLDVRSALNVKQGGSSSFGNWIYTARLYDHDLQVYERNGNSVTYFETLPGFNGPFGTHTTPNGWWYIAESGNADVAIYQSKKSGPVGPFPPLVDYGQVPVNVDVLPNRRLVAVSNQSTLSSGSGSVSIYLNRQTNPSRMLTYGSGKVAGMGVAISHQGDCYWSINGTSSGSGAIVKFPACNGSGSVVVSGIPVVGGIIFDQSDNLYYIDQTYGIYQCKKVSACQPFVAQYPGSWINMNFDHKSKDIWVADTTGYIVEVSDLTNKKKGPTVTRTATEGGASGGPYGIAPAPGQ